MLLDLVIPHTDPCPVQNSQEKENGDRKIPSSRKVGMNQSKMHKKHHHEKKRNPQESHMGHERTHGRVAVEHFSPLEIKQSEAGRVGILLIKSPNPITIPDKNRRTKCVVKRRYGNPGDTVKKNATSWILPPSKNSTHYSSTRKDLWRKNSCVFAGKSVKHSIPIRLPPTLL